MLLIFKTKNKFLIFKIHFLVFEKNTDSLILEIQYSI